MVGSVARSFRKDPREEHRVAELAGRHLRLAEHLGLGLARAPERPEAHAPYAEGRYPEGGVGARTGQIQRRLVERIAST